MSDPATNPTAEEASAKEGNQRVEPSKPTGSLWRRVGPAGVLGILWASLPAIGGITLLSLLGPISEWLRGHEEIGIVIYVVGFIVAAGVGFLPTYSQAVLAGWVFGVAIGLPAALAGFTGAALIGYGITRFVSHHRLEEVIDEHPKAAAIRRALVGRSFWRTLGVVTLIRVPPNSPFALTNLALAGAGVRLPEFTLGTLFGMAPRTFIAVFFAASAAATGARDIQTFVKEGLGIWVFVVGLVLMIIALAVIGVIANHALERVTQEEHDGAVQHSLRNAARNGESTDHQD